MAFSEDLCLQGHPHNARSRLSSLSPPPLVHLAPISDACVGPENLQLQKFYVVTRPVLSGPGAIPCGFEMRATPRADIGLRDTRARCLVLAPVPCAL